MRAIILIPDPDYPEPWQWAFDVEAAALRTVRATVNARPWTDLGDLRDADIVLPLVAWGYQGDPARWHAAIDAMERGAAAVANPAAVLRWNSDKNYLVDLADAGVPTIPTLRFDHFGDAALAQARATFGEDIVVKPPISASAHGTHRLRAGDDLPSDALGRPMLAQPFLSAVASEGEYSLLLFGGEFSHCLVKVPKDGDYRVQPHLGGSATLCAPPAGAIALAKSALAVAPGKCAYARVDLLRDEEGTLRIIELELIEPALWLDLAPGAPTAFASAVFAAAGHQPLA